MALAGSLEDVTVADVMQFVHLGRGTGTLTLNNEGLVAEIGFHDGSVINAHLDNAPNLGELLVARGLVSREGIDQALEIQRRQRNPQPIGEILIESGAVEDADILRCLTDQFRTAILSVFRWRGGSFEFIRGTPRCNEQAVGAGRERLMRAKLSTERLLLEAAQILDENSLLSGPFNLEPVEPAPPLPVDQVDSEWQDMRRSLIEGETDQDQLSNLGIQVETREPELAEAVRSHLVADPEATRLLRTGGRRFLLIDLRSDESALGAVRIAARERPGTHIVTIIDRSDSAQRVYEAGARAAVPPDPAAIAACLKSLVRQPGGGDHERLAAALHRLRNVMGQIRSGAITTTVALTLMNFVGEVVERAVLFLVRRDDLRAIGAFGFGIGLQPLAELTRHLSVDLVADNVLTRAIAERNLLSEVFDDAALPFELADVLSRPAHDQVIAVPLLGMQRVLAVLYADNGEVPRPIADLPLLDIAAQQAGTVLENELLRRQLQVAGVR